MHKGKEVKEKLDNMINTSPSKLRDRMKIKTQKYKLYVYRFLSSGTLSNAKPCAECTRWICTANYLGIQYKVFYTDDDEKVKPFDSRDSSNYIPKHTYF